MYATSLTGWRASCRSCRSSKIGGRFGQLARSTARGRSPRQPGEGDEDPQAEDVEGSHPAGGKAPPFLREAQRQAEAEDARGAQAASSRGEAPRGSEALASSFARRTTSSQSRS